MTRLPRLATLAAALALAGCMTPPTQPEPPAPTSAAQAGLHADVQMPPVDAQWWRSLGDAQLDALVDRALADQPSLAVAAARVARAAAAVQGENAAAGPTLGLGLDATRLRYSETGLFPPPIAGSTRTSADAQITGRWELDFFGRHDAALAAALGQQRAAEADAQAARVLLASQLARQYVALARLIDQRRIAERALAWRAEVLALTRQRVQAGFDTNVELRQAEGALPDARQQIEALDEQVHLARHQLAVLAGQPATALADASPALATLQPPALPERLGADLLGRRADIAAARWRIEAASQQVARARTDYYPDINLVGFLGLNALGLSNLLDFGSRNSAFGPALRLPLFDAGRLDAALLGRSAERDAAIAAYNGAVLDAVREVADAGVSVRSVERQREQQALAQAAAESAYALAQQRYRAGLGTYLIVLATETNVLAQRRLAADLRARALEARIALMRALGGGWQGSPAAS